MPDGSTLDRDAALASELRTSVLRLRRRLVNERHPDNQLSFSAMAVLGCLHVRGDQTAADLARHERVQPPSMARLLKGLIAQGLVVRRPHESDGRQMWVSLTEHGRATVLADRDRREAWLARRLIELGPEERRILAEAAPVLARLAQDD